MTWLPVGALDLQEIGPYSARDEDEMIELIDLIHSDYQLRADKRGRHCVRFFPRGSPTEGGVWHTLVDQRACFRQVEGPRPDGEWVRSNPLYTDEWWAARAARLVREEEDGTNEMTVAMIAELGIYL